jgi:heme/copper-type cytochrome/quinol oxidase subunit 2
MSSRQHRIPPARWVLVAPILAATLVAGCSSAGGSSGGSAGATQSSSGPQTIQVRVTGNTVQGGVRRVKVKLDSQVRLEVTADRADEVHLHGYDKKVDAQPGKPAVLEFRADTPGVFEVELEHAGQKLLELEVS